MTYPENGRDYIAKTSFDVESYRNKKEKMQPKNYLDGRNAGMIGEKGYMKRIGEIEKSGERRLLKRCIWIKEDVNIRITC